MTDHERAFFIELFRICQKYDATIGGCGCCGSPYVKVGENYFDDLSVDRDDLSVEGRPLPGGFWWPESEGAEPAWITEVKVK